MKKADIVGSLVIGEAAALLMVAIARMITVPAAAVPFVPLLPLIFPIVTLAIMIAGIIAAQRLMVVYQLSKFLLVGGLNFLIDLGVLNLLIAGTGISTGFYANLYKAIAFSVAMFSSYAWNKFWTFRARTTLSAPREFGEFFLVTVTGFFINVGVFALMNDVIGARYGANPPTWASISAGIASIVGLAWNFAGYKFVVFRRRESRT